MNGILYPPWIFNTRIRTYSTRSRILVSRTSTYYMNICMNAIWTGSHCKQLIFDQPFN